MATMWADLDLEFQKLLGNRLTTIDDVMRISFFNKAQRNFALVHTAKMLSTSFDGDGSSMEFILPDDFIDAYAVYLNDDDGEILEPVQMTPGIRWDKLVDASSVKPKGYMVWPHGKLTLTYPPEEVGTGEGNVELFYFGYWADVDDGTGTEVEAPLWAHEPLLLYALALSIVPDAVNTDDLRRWNTNIDSGRPTDNPLRVAHDMLMKRYNDLLAAWPRQVRTMNFIRGGRS